MRVYCSFVSKANGCKIFQGNFILSHIRTTWPSTKDAPRHTCATLMARSGVDPVAIKQILDHTDYAFTVNNYTHKDTDFLYENLKKMH